VFAGIVHEAALDARAEVSVVEKRMQSRDHPVVLGMPETYYLKCFILRKLSSSSVDSRQSTVDSR
jgi:23S rRNA (cytosine1962-C5)-methyltransferase